MRYNITIIYIVINLDEVLDVVSVKRQDSFVILRLILLYSENTLIYLILHYLNSFFSNKYINIYEKIQYQKVIFSFSLFLHPFASINIKYNIYNNRFI